MIIQLILSPLYLQSHLLCILITLSSPPPTHTHTFIIDLFLSERRLFWVCYPERCPLMPSYHVNNNKCAPNLVFFNEKKIEKDSDDFWHRELTLKIKLWHFLRNKMQQFWFPMLIFERNFNKFWATVKEIS